MLLLIVLIVAIVVSSVLLMVGAVLGVSYLYKRKGAADLTRYLQDGSCKWERIAVPSDAADDHRSILYKNTAPESSGIEMRAYYYSQLPEGAEDEGVCLSIIDPKRNNGMILNGFDRVLDAMQFGDGLWNDRFLGDAGIMERTIAETRVAWDQMQMEIIVGRYGLFM